MGKKYSKSSLEFLWNNIVHCSAPHFNPLGSYKAILLLKQVETQILKYSTFSKKDFLHMLIFHYYKLVRYFLHCSLLQKQTLVIPLIQYFTLTVGWSV